MNDKIQKTVLQVESISKCFSNVKAVNNISFTVNQGDIFAFLGPNGAGKTTSLRLILDIIKSDSGQINWNMNGKQSHIPLPAHIGYLPEERGLYPDIPILKSLIALGNYGGRVLAGTRFIFGIAVDILFLTKTGSQNFQGLHIDNRKRAYLE